MRRNNQAGFLDFRYSPHPRASLNFGARAEANGNFGTRVVPRAGASLALAAGTRLLGETRLRAFYGQGIKEPRFDQIFDDDFGDIGNPALKPESSKTWTIGLDQKLDNDRLRLTGEYFSSRFYDMISFAFCDLSNTFCNLPPGTGPGFGFGYFFNTDRARARGTNITAEAKIARWLMMKGNYTYDDSLILQAANPFDPTQLPGNRLARRPLNSGSFTALASWRRFGAALSGYFSGQRTDSDFLGLNLTRTPGYARFELAATYQFSHGISTYLRAANLFDKSYQDALGYPALGREVRLGMAYRFGGRN